MQAQHGGNTLIREEVSEEDIAGVVSRWTGIPAARLLEGRACRSFCTSKRSCTGA